MSNTNAQGNTVIEEIYSINAYKEIGKAIQSKRKEKKPNIKHSEIFAITGLLSAYLSRVENGRWRSELDNLFKMTASVGLSLQEAVAADIFSKPLPLTDEARTGNSDIPRGLPLMWIGFGLAIQGFAQFLRLNIHG
jgi:hypothetical protein